MPEFLRRAAGHYQERCGDCFEMRLRKTAEAARANGYDAFTTTLLISPQQKHELIKEVGEKAGRESGVDFFYADLRKRYSDSRHITKPMELLPAAVLRVHLQRVGTLHARVISS